jgi:uncharacterized protein (TIGR02246 family)
MPATDPEQLHALIEAAFNAGDPDALVELYEPDAILIVPPHGERVAGSDRIRAAVQPTFALRPSARISVLGKLEGDGLALTHARWEMIGDRDGARNRLTGRGTVVSRRQDDGSWRIVLDNPLSPR